LKKDLQYMLRELRAALDVIQFDTRVDRNAKPDHSQSGRGFYNRDLSFALGPVTAELMAMAKALVAAAPPALAFVRTKRGDRLSFTVEPITGTQVRVVEVRWGAVDNARILAFLFRQLIFAIIFESAGFFSRRTPFAERLSSWLAFAKLLRWLPPPGRTPAPAALRARAVRRVRPATPDLVSAV
jgi:hypothetical protein